MSDTPTEQSRTRSVISAVLVVLACISIVAATAGVWVDRTIFNERKYVATASAVIEDPAVTQAVANELTDQIFVALGVQQRIDDALSSISSDPTAQAKIALLSAPLTAGAKNLIAKQVDKFLQTDTFRTIWVSLNEKVHEKVVALLKGDYDQLPAVDVSGAVVKLNFVPVVADVLRQLAQQGLDLFNVDRTIPEIPPGDAEAGATALASALGTTLPPDFGQVTIMSSNSLTGLQTIARDMRLFGLVLVVLSALLVAGAIWLASDRRRTVVWLGAGAVIALLLGAVVARNLSQNALDSIGPGPGADVVKAVVAVLGRSLRHTALFVGLVAIVVAVVAYLRGRPDWWVRLQEHHETPPEEEPAA